MGSGIAQTCAAAGYRTIMLDISAGAVESGLTRIRAFLDSGVAKGKLSSEARESTLGKLSGVTDVASLSACDVIIEAIVESLDEKRRTYEALDVIAPPHAIFLSNTSSLCITELAATTRRPDRFGGLHFFNPVPQMKLVEVIRGLGTSESTYQQVLAFARSLGKEPVTAPDRPGFIVNRLLVPYLLDAIRSYENGLGSLEDIDAAMKLGCGHPMGPFQLLDFVGLDTIYYIANIMSDEFREPAYAPPPLLKRMVLAGRLGRKSGQGFYSY
jgi:3-hydroxybutyryl-CoA dehydrogenase